LRWPPPDWRLSAGYSYERIFTACRLPQDALSDYLVMDQNVTDRSDPFLNQVLGILQERGWLTPPGYDFAVAPADETH
jgi:hypothetical protein